MTTNPNLRYWITRTVVPDVDPAFCLSQVEVVSSKTIPNPSQGAVTLWYNPDNGQLHYWDSKLEAWIEGLPAGWDGVPFASWWRDQHSEIKGLRKQVEHLVNQRNRSLTREERAYALADSRQSDIDALNTRISSVVKQRDDLMAQLHVMTVLKEDMERNARIGWESRHATQADLAKTRAELAGARAKIHEIEAAERKHATAYVNDGARISSLVKERDGLLTSLQNAQLTLKEEANAHIKTKALLVGLLGDLRKILTYDRTPSFFGNAVEDLVKHYVKEAGIV